MRTRSKYRVFKPKDFSTDYSTLLHEPKPIYEVSKVLSGNKKCI